ncbi:long-chain fatty acid transport protein 2-like [Mytilus galloprovincialis]|uniref:long-chain fatty acid transport protein 2-like n=1 Tax=Mytilus galloprovincialis TaxID=29158 RepID=UPI003F7B972B
MPPTGKEAALLGVGGVVGVSLAAWRTLFPWIGYDLPILKLGRKYGKKTMTDALNGHFLVDLFEISAKNNPKKPFIIFQDRIFTYEFMNEQACRVANIVLQMGLKLGDTVAILVSNEPAFVWTFLGLQKIGVAVALLNTNNKHKPLLHSIEISEAKVLIVGQGSDLFQNVDDIKQELPIPVYLMGTGIGEAPVGYQSWDQLMLSAPHAEISRTMRSGMNLLTPCCYIYTSGTTGLPKPAIINQTKALGMSKFLYLGGLEHDDIVYTVTPLYHSAAILALFTTMDCGSTMLLRTKFSAHHYFEDCRRHNVTVIQYIGELCRYLLAVPEHPKDKVHKIKVAVGNGLRKDIWEKFRDRFNIPQIVEFFGASEGTAATFNVNGRVGACGRLSPLLSKLHPSGMAIIKYDRLKDAPYRDKNNRCLPVEFGEPGLFIAGIPEFYKDKFYKGPQEVNEKKVLRNVFKDGDSFFNFGDLMYMDKDYFIYFQDRVGDTFRWKGENVSTNEVANILTSMDFIHDANIYGVTVPGHDGRAGMAALHLNEREKLTKERLKQIYDHCSENLPSYARPLFLRLEEQTRVTVTFKQHKVDLVKEGYDPSIISDPLYYLSNDAKTYVPLDASSFGSVLKSRL